MHSRQAYDLNRDGRPALYRARSRRAVRTNYPRPMQVTVVHTHFHNDPRQTYLNMVDRLNSKVNPLYHHSCHPRSNERKRASSGPIACENFDTTLIICPETGKKIEVLIIEVSSLRFVRSMSAQIGYCPDNCAIEPFQSLAGVQFLGLAAAFVSSLGTRVRLV